MSKYDELYEGIISKIGKKISDTIKKGGDKIEKGAKDVDDKVAGKIEKGKEVVGKASRSIAKKTLEKTPLGFVNRAKKAISKLNKEFEYLSTSTNDQLAFLNKTKGKIDALRGKITNRYKDDKNNEDIKNLLNDIDSFSAQAKKLSSAIQSLNTSVATVTGIGKDEADTRKKEKKAASSKARRDTKKAEKETETEEPVTESFELYSEKRYELFCEEWNELMEDLDVDGNIVRWKKSKSDGLTIYKSGDYEIRQTYDGEPKWTISKGDRHIGDGKSATELKDFAEEDAKIN